MWVDTGANIARRQGGFLSILINQIFQQQRSSLPNIIIQWVEHVYTY